MFLVQISFKSFGFVYIYPVATGENIVFYTYQKSLTDLELWRLFLPDNNSLQAEHLEKCLYWRFVPAGFALLPDNKCFSFIDSGRLWIKAFAKRSPRAISFDQPVFNISEVCWLEDKICYFSAKQDRSYAIFIGDIQKQTLKILHDPKDKDCLSPRIIDNQLFCIERQAHDRSCLIIKLDLNDAHKINNNQINQRVIMDCGYQQIIYLKMCTPKLGFYIEHMPYINDHAQAITLICHKIELVDSKWINTKIFRFLVPKCYLFGEQRLYESILPFLPRAKKTRLYFSDIKQNEAGQYHSSIFEFDLISLKRIGILKSEQNMIFFAPLKANHTLFYGKIWEGSVEQDLSIGQLSLKKQA